MTIPITKKTIFDKMGTNKHIEIAKRIQDNAPDDKKEIQRIMKLFARSRDARGRWSVNESVGRELLVYFRKYVDGTASNNLFGCGGCAQKMVSYMNQINNVWRNQIK
tara:strand:- start:1892 stop:2212 length:321 start_codon:yes stop_codon:yes gene_type:complete